MRWIRTSCAIAALFTTQAIPAAAGDDIAWFFGAFDEALARADEKEQSVLVYFWMPSSEACGRMYEETLSTAEAAELTRAFVCYTANHAEEGAPELFERYAITTVPAIRIVRPSGEADDGLTGFADVGELERQLRRILAGELTLTTLRAQAEANPTDLELRNLVAGKLQDLGDQEGHDALQASIKADDPDGETLVAARLLFGDMVGEVTRGASQPSELRLEPAYAHAEKQRHDSVAVLCWGWIATMENARGDFEAELAAYRRAWQRIDEPSVLNWGDTVAAWMWSNRDLLSDADKALALEMATRATERAEILAQKGEDGFGNRYTGDDPDGFLAERLATLAKCLYMNGERDRALALISRCVELDPDDGGYARRLALYRAKRPDECVDVYADTRPVWSQTGSKIAFTSDRDGNQEIYVADVRSGKVTRMTRYRGNEEATSWSDKEIGFTSDRFLTNGIYAMKSNGKDEHMLLPFDSAAPVAAFDPYFSPDGTRVAFATNQNGKSEIAVLDARSGAVAVLTADTPMTDMAPTWSMDGERILFMSNRGGDSDVYSIEPDGEHDVNVTNAASGSWDMDPQLSPDGEKIAFASWRSGQLEVYVMDADGSSVVNLTNSPTEDRHPRWSPNGKQIAFDRKLADGSTRIFLMKADGRDVRPLLAE